MAIHITAVDGMGEITESGGVYTTTGMKTEDHMQVGNDFIPVAGVLKTTDCEVSENSPAGMSVLVSKGTFYIENTSYSENSTGQTKYWRPINDSDSASVSITSNSSGNPVYSSIFAKFDASASPDDNGTNVVTFVEVVGTAAASPTPPATPSDGNSYIRLADVYVANGASSITNSNITDRRTIISLDGINSDSTKVNLLENGNFINNSTNGYGSTADDWTSSNANPVQGGFTVNEDGLDKAGLISLLGVTDGQIEGLWFLNETSGDATDYSSNGYDLTDNNTVTSSDDGLIGKARDFESGNSEYLSIADASCANLEISGSQTWFAYVKPESMPGSGATRILEKASSAEKQLRISLDASFNPQFSFYLQGLTTNVEVISDVTPEAGKWYFVVASYDSSNTELNIWVNGIRNTETASGSATDSDGNFVIGRDDSGASDYYDGLIQYAGVLSTALSDDQVKRLTSATLYKGTKIRRSTSDAILSQSLEQDKVERLRGKYVTLRAKYSSDTESAPYISIDDGTDTESDAVVYTDQYGTLTLTKQIDEDATEITVKLKHKDTDGSTWFEEVALYEGHTAFPYAHSPEDWNRFPKILQLTNIDKASGYLVETDSYYRTVAFKAYLGSTQSIPSSAWEKIEFDTITYDVGSDFNTTTHKFTAPIDGVYHFSFVFRLNGLADGDRTLTACYVNSVQKDYGFDYVLGGGLSPVVPFSTDLLLDAGDEVEFAVYQDSGSAQSTTANSQNCVVNGHLVTAT